MLSLNHTSVKALLTTLLRFVKAPGASSPVDGESGAAGEPRESQGSQYKLLPPMSQPRSRVRCNSRTANSSAPYMSETLCWGSDPWIIRRRTRYDGTNEKDASGAANVLCFSQDTEP